MYNFVFNNDKFFTYHWCGKFQSTTDEWMHLTRNLIDFELAVVTEGILYIALDDEEYAVEKGSYILMPPTRNQHGYKQSGCSFYWMHFSIGVDFEPAPDSYSIMNNNDIFHLSEDVEHIKFDDKNTYIPLIGKLNSPERVIILMKQLQDCDKRYHNNHMNNILTGAVLSEVACQNTLYQKHTQLNQTKQIFNDIIDYIQYHSSENITVKEIADYFGYNPKYLSSFFKKQAGTTLKQYMLQSKMEVAKAELTDTNHPISQIAYNLGFDDAHNFTNAFKKITGLSPTEYREGYGKRALFYN